MSKPSLRDVISSFKCEADENHEPLSRPKNARKVSKTSPKKRRKDLEKKGEPNTHTKSLKDLPPSIVPDISIIFVGFNPGVESSKRQHHYAHPTNLFWKLFNASDLLSAVLDLRDVDISSENGLISDIYNNGVSSARPEHDYKLINLGVGFTDLVLRCTKQASELTTSEKLENVPRLLEEFNTAQAPFVVFIGKGIWEVVCKYLIPKHKLNADNFTWGIQEDLSIISRFNSFCPYRPRVYVFPNTSGLVASMKYPQKLELWENLVKAIKDEASSR